MANSSSTKERQWVLDESKSKPWFSKGGCGVGALISLTIIDVSGFLEGVLLYCQWYHGDDDDLEKILAYISGIIMVIGFAAAFEFATLYMSYAYSLKLYQYDRYALKKSQESGKNDSLSKLVSTSALGWFAFIAFLIGVVTNIFFRVGLFGWDGIQAQNSLKLKAIYILENEAFNIVMMILPIITSIINFVVGCFTFDPILFEMNNISKQIENCKLNISDLTAKKEKAQLEISKIQELKNLQKEQLESAKKTLEKKKPVYQSELFEEVVLCCQKVK